MRAPAPSALDPSSVPAFQSEKMIPTQSLMTGSERAFESLDVLQQPAGAVIRKDQCHERHCKPAKVQFVQLVLIRCREAGLKAILTDSSTCEENEWLMDNDGVIKGFFRQ